MYTWQHVCYTLPFYWSSTFFHQESISTSGRRGEACNCNHTQTQGRWKLLKGGAAIDHHVRGCGVGSYNFSEAVKQPRNHTKCQKKISHQEGCLVIICHPFSIGYYCQTKSSLWLGNICVTVLANAGKSKFNFLLSVKAYIWQRNWHKSAVALTALATAAPMDLKQWNISHNLMYAEMLTGPGSGLKNPGYM